MAPGETSFDPGVASRVLAYLQGQRYRSPHFSPESVATLAQALPPPTDPTATVPEAVETDYARLILELKGTSYWPHIQARLGRDDLRSLSRQASRFRTLSPPPDALYRYWRRQDVQQAVHDFLAANPDYRQFHEIVLDIHRQQMAPDGGMSFREAFLRRVQDRLGSSEPLSQLEAR